MTGATGFIGAHVVRELLARDVAVTALVRATSPRDRIADVIEDVDVVEADLAAIERVGERDACIHLAWFAEPGAYLQDADENRRSLDDSRRLLDLVSGRLVTTGTCVEPPDVHPTMSSTPYAVAKRAFHEEVAASPDGLCAHVHYLYGPLEDPRRLVASVVNALLDGERIAVTHGEQARELLHVRDVARALCDLAASDAVGWADVCAGEPRPIRDVLGVIGEITGRSELIGYGERPYPPGEPTTIAGDPEVLLRTGWRPSMTLEAGVADTVSWWQRQRAR